MSGIEGPGLIGGGAGPNNPALSGSFAVQLTGINALITNFDWELTNGVVTITTTSSGLAVSNSTNLEIPAGTLPVAIRPSPAQLVPCSIGDAGALKIGRADIASAGAGGAGGVFFAAPDATGVLSSSGFSAVGIKGLALGTTFSYPL